MSLPNDYKGNVITISQEILAKDRKVVTYDPTQYRLQSTGEKLITINGVKHYSAFFWPDVPQCRAMLETIVEIGRRHEEENGKLLTMQLDMGNMISQGEI